VIVKAGSRAELPCEAVGVPEPELSWQLHDQPIDASKRHDDSLVFTKVTPEDAKVYTCKASNWAGNVFKDIELVVLGGYL
jgi:hypothetical protein